MVNMLNGPSAKSAGLTTPRESRLKTAVRQRRVDAFVKLHPTRSLRNDARQSLFTPPSRSTARLSRWRLYLEVELWLLCDIGVHAGFI